MAVEKIALHHEKTIGMIMLINDRAMSKQTKCLITVNLTIIKRIIEDSGSYCENINMGFDIPCEFIGLAAKPMTYPLIWATCKYESKLRLLFGHVKSTFGFELWTFSFKDKCSTTAPSWVGQLLSLL